MATYNRPGVYIQEVPLQQSVSVVDTATAIGGFSGTFPSGPAGVPTLVTTWTQFTKTFGGLNDSYPATWAVYNFFANHGTSLYVNRVVSSTAAKGAVTLTDGSGTSTTTTATVTAAAASAGTITYTATNTYSAGQTVSVTGLNGSVTITGITATGTAVTYATASTTGLSSGQSITITGATTSGFNGTYTITGVVTNTSFTVTSTATGSSSTATGTYSSAFNLTGVAIATASSSQFTVTSATTDRSVSSASGTATVVTTTPSNNAIVLTAKNEGTWSSSYSVLASPSGSTGRFNLSIFYTVVQNGQSSTSTVERYSDLSMTASDSNYFIAVINSYSSIVTAALASNNTVTNGTAIYAPTTSATTATSFSGGLDGTTPVVLDYKNGWSNFDSVNNALVLYAADAPYRTLAADTYQMHADAMIYAAGRTDCFVVVDTPSQIANAALAQGAVTSTALLAAGATSGNIAAAYWPWINIPDPTKIQGATRLQAPGAAVVGQYLATDASRGPAKTPAGLLNKIALAVSTEHSFTNAELDALNTSIDPVNTIRQAPGAGIVIMGGRTLDGSPNNRYINIRRSLIYIEKQMNNLSQFAVFENNDSILWNKLQTVLGSFLFNYWNSGGLRGSSPSQAYYVKCDATTTSFSDIQAGIVNIQIGVALQYPAEFVVITLSQLTGSASA